MLSFIAKTLTSPTRHEKWSPPPHWHDRPRGKSAWEIERDLAAERDAMIRRTGIF